MTADPPSNEPRTIGRYVLHDEIASGGMATVHLGRLVGEGGFKRTVAIKRMHVQYAKNPAFVDMFMDEARLAARVQHPNVVATLDVLRLDDELFQVMEYVHGLTLAKLMRLLRRRTTPMPLPIVGAVLTRVLYGLHAAHEAMDDHGDPLDIIHRDVSPQNVIVGADGVARVLDFGVAKAAVRIQSTSSGQVKGKLAYMAPEQLLGEEIDRRADIYAAGILAWEMLAGRRMRRAESEGQMYHMVIEGDVKPPSLHAEVPSEVDEVVLTALAPRREDRFETANEFADRVETAFGIASPREVSAFVAEQAPDILEPLSIMLKEVESGHSGARRTVAVAEEEATRAVGDASLKDAAFATSAMREYPSKRRGMWVGAALLLVVVAVLVGREVLRSGEATPVSASAPVDSSAAPVPTDDRGGDVAPKPPLPAPPSAPPPTPEPPAPDATSDPTSKESAKDPPPASPSPRPWKPPAPSVSAPPKPAPPTAPNCNPPYYVTKDGARKFKVECLQ